MTAADVEAGLHRAANRAREREGLAVLDADPALAAIARAHSADLARRGVVEHVTPDGGDPNTRAAAAGLTCRITVSATQTRVGFLENLARSDLYRRRETATRGGVTRTTTDWRTSEDLATETIDGWLASPTHRPNLLDALARREGIGVAIGADDGVYITQMLCG